MAGQIDKTTGALRVSLEDIYPMTFPTLLQYVSKGKDFILIGEQDHKNINGYFEATSTKAIETYKALGFKHLCFELPKEWQPNVDAFYQGKISFEALKAHYQTKRFPWHNDRENLIFTTHLAETVRNAKAAGIKVHYTDTLELLPVEKQHPQLAQLMRKTLFAKSSQQLESDPLLQDPQIVENIQKFLQQFKAERLTRDRNTAIEISALAKDGKVAVLGGLGHFTDGRDYSNFLGADRSVVIALQKSWEETGPPSLHLPHYVFYTDLTGSSYNPSSQTITAGAKIQSDDRRSEACKAAINVAKKIYHLVGCTTFDDALNSYSKTQPYPKYRPEAPLPLR